MPHSDGLVKHLIKMRRRGSGSDGPSRRRGVRSKVCFAIVGVIATVFRVETHFATPPNIGSLLWLGRESRRRRFSRTGILLSVAARSPSLIDYSKGPIACPDSLFLRSPGSESIPVLFAIPG